MAPNFTKTETKPLVLSLLHDIHQDVAVALVDFHSVGPHEIQDQHGGRTATLIHQCLKPWLWIGPALYFTSGDRMSLLARGIDSLALPAASF